jgi:hypothetical protein
MTNLVGGSARGGNTDQVFFENGQTVTPNYCYYSGKNAVSARACNYINWYYSSSSNWLTLGNRLKRKMLMAGTVVCNTLNTDTGLFSTQNAYQGIAKAWVNFGCVPLGRCNE